MITSVHRFHGYNSLRYAYQNGKTFRGPFGTIKVAQNKRNEMYRVAVVVSKKVSKSSVVRNRIRRRLYELVRTNLAEDQAVDIIFSVFTDRAAVVPLQELREATLAQFQAANLHFRASADEKS